MLADIADDGGEHVVDRAVAAYQLVESGDRVGGNAEPGNVDRCARRTGGGGAGEQPDQNRMAEVADVTTHQLLQEIDRNAGHLDLA